LIYLLAKPCVFNDFLIPLFLSLCNRAVFVVEMLCCADERRHDVDSCPSHPARSWGMALGLAPTPVDKQHHRII
jgi:hypothetical protein